MAQLLVLEDDARIGELVTWFLGREGHEVRLADSLGRAEELLAEAQPDLLLCDVQVGDELASDWLPRISAAGSLPATLIVSGYADAALTGSLRQLPEVLGSLRKPFEMTQLIAAVQGCLEQDSARPSNENPASRE